MSEALRFVENEKVLVICASRGRPQQCLELIESFLQTSKMSMLRICLDTDDPCLEQYRDVIKGRVPYVVADRKTTTEIINENWRYASDCFKWFSVTNDDFVYKTDGWDRRLVGEIALNGGLGIAYGNDLLQGVNMPTSSIVSREIVKALGWLQMPTLTHLFGDNVWQHIGQACGCLFYREDIVVEHRHWANRRTPIDAIYQHTNSGRMYDVDGLAFIRWKENQAAEDIGKVKNLLQNSISI